MKGLIFGKILMVAAILSAFGGLALAEECEFQMDGTQLQLKKTPTGAFENMSPADASSWMHCKNHELVKPVTTGEAKGASSCAVGSTRTGSKGIGVSAAGSDAAPARKSGVPSTSGSAGTHE